ncbi:MAG TPA: tetratricopeptide repeat protein, partial [Acidobacteriaceae bacterium]|nr:tetratricopeptide repeat protein [Acidobacteriaceae bacterium]
MRRERHVSGNDAERGLWLGWALSLVMGGALLGGAVVAVGQSSSAKPKHHAKAHVAAKSAAAKSTAKNAGSKKAKAGTSHAKSRRRRVRSAAGRAARSAKLRQAFVVSTELRPMAQQLTAIRTPAAFAGVAAYARSHQGEAAASAYMALGHAYMLDNKFNEAAANFRQAHAAGDALADYAEYLGAKADHDAGNDTAAEALLKNFGDRNPDSIFVSQAPELEAQVLLALKDTAGAKAVLEENSDLSGRVGYQFALAEVNRALGQNDEAGKLYKHVLLAWPLSYEAGQARTRLAAMGMESSLTPTELRSLGDAYYNAGKYGEASDQYRALARVASPETRNGFAVAAAACDLKLKRLTVQEAEALQPSRDENGARRLYLLMELARNRDDVTAQANYVDQLRTGFPSSQWFAEALFSSGNMYLLRKDYPRAVTYYSELAEHFPKASNAAAAHWRAGWWSYRQGLYVDAARIFEEQIKLYPRAKETASALYWRARLYESKDHNAGLAAAHYRTLIA